MLPDPQIDAIVACAPPDITTEVALECAKAGKRCVATKPLMWTEMPLRFSSYERLTTCLYVDLWRLYSPAWLAMKEELRGKKIDEVHIGFCGNGPHRSFPGVLDYGPHALAFMYDLLGECELKLRFPPAWPMAERGDMWTGAFKSKDEVRAFVTIGNGAAEPHRFVKVLTPSREYTFDEPDGGSEIDSYDRNLSATKALALRRFCRAFMAGEPSRTLEYSICAQRLLERIIGENK